jgi:hypothetical protein
VGTINLDTYRKIDLGIKFFCLIGIAATFVMFLVFKDEIYEDNEKARKEFSLNIALNAEDKIGTGLECAYFLADIPEDELKQIFSFDELDIDNVHIDAVKRCLAEQKSGDLLKSSQKEKHSTLAKAGSYYVFHQTMHDLNLLDTLASAYYTGIVDKDMIVKLFGSLFEAKPVESLIGKLNSIGLTNFIHLEKYLREAKGKDYPAGKLPLGR